MKASVVIHVLLAAATVAAAVPDVVRDTSYDWRCVDSAGSVISSHQRQDKAIVACQNQAEANPGATFYIEAGRYRVSTAAAPPPDPDPDPEPTFATLSWQAPTQMVDGQPLDRIIKYTIWRGLESRNYTESLDLPANATGYMWEYADGPWYYAVTVEGCDANNVCGTSDYSNEGVK